MSRLGAPLHLGTYVEAGVPPQSNPGVRWNNHHKELKARDVNQADPNLPAREDVGADFAILLVMDKGEPGAPIYGVAYTQHTDCAGVTNCDIGSAGYRDFAYAVVSIHPDAQNLTFAHEIGHMLGNQHDPPPPPVPTAAFAYSYGHRTASERDIMADPPCIDAVCPLRLPQFSNPSVFFAGTTTPSGVAGARDVAKTIYATIGGSTNIYPIAGEDPIHVFWDGFEH